MANVKIKGLNQIPFLLNQAFYKIKLMFIV